MIHLKLGDLFERNNRLWLIAWSSNSSKKAAFTCLDGTFYSQLFTIKSIDNNGIITFQYPTEEKNILSWINLKNKHNTFIGNIKYKPLSSSKRNRLLNSAISRLFTIIINIPEKDLP